MRRAFLLAIISGAAVAAPPEHSLPLDCVPGESCWIVNYVDTAAGPEARDYTCGTQTYDGHTGTDFAVRHPVAMGQGVAVLASAPGVVKARRDGVPDRSPGERLPPEPPKNACGNGVVIDHGDGWETQYCHLRQGSVRVERGQRVERGAALGLVGRSGFAAFSHVHFTLRRAGKVVDPFTGSEPSAGCGRPKAAHWTASSAEALRYRLAAIFDGGIAGARVSSAAAYGEAETMPAGRDSEALVGWAALLGVRAGDEVHLSLTGPDGKVIARYKRVLERTQARYYLSAGRKRPPDAWVAGEYRVEVEVTRGGEKVIWSYRTRI